MRRTLCIAAVGCLALMVLLLPATTRADSITGGDTSVALNPSTVTALTGLGLTLSPLGAATLNAPTLTITFPITGGTIGASGAIIQHDGSGFALSNGTTTVDLENFVIDTSTLLLSGKVVAGTTVIPSLNLFDIGAGDALTLDSAAGGALAGVFGIPNLTGAPIGTATVSPQVATPEPSAFGLTLAGLAAAALLTLRRRSVFSQAA